MRNCNLKVIIKTSCCLLTIALFTNCKTLHNSTSNRKMNKEVYIDQFKLTYFRELLLKSYNNSKDIQNIIELDRSGFTEPILTFEDYKIIDSITTNDNIKLTADSTNRIGRVAEGSEGKHILGYAINKIKSKWLDSLANKRYKFANVEQRFKG